MTAILMLCLGGLICNISPERYTFTPVVNDKYLKIFFLCSELQVNYKIKHGNINDMNIFPSSEKMFYLANE